MEQYQPVSCDLYDELESITTNHQQAELVFREGDGSVQTAVSRISDIFTREHEEYVKLIDGRIVRLDRILSLNGKRADSYVH